MLLNPGPETYIFLIYFGQFTLLSIVAVLLSKRYAFVFFVIFFFGMGDPIPEILHIWRASHAILIFLIGIILYFKSNKKIGRLIIYMSIGFHLSILLLVFAFELYFLLSLKIKYFLTVIVGAIIFYLVIGYFEIIMTRLFPFKADLFFIQLRYERNFTREIILISLLVASRFKKLSDISLFAIFLFVCYYIFESVHGGSARFMTRIAQLVNPVVSIVLFEVVIKQKKPIVLIVITLIFIRLLINPSIEMYALTIPEHRNLFHGIISALY